MSSALLIAHECGVFVLTRTGKYISGEVILPHYRKVFSGVSGSFVAKSIQSVLTGKRCVSFVWYCLLLCHFVVTEIQT